mmetsp:Transcript_17933/g.58025  ORF Transcript_17933/g.58025 Transcript_17933/m.58025 type:complete len:112 (+) Transcript_17933:579-914(+)
MAGIGHEMVASELSGQCRDYAKNLNHVAGVRLELRSGGGLEDTDNGNGKKNPDGGIRVADFGPLTPRFMFEVDVKNNAPVGIADRAVELFNRYHLLRALLQLKFYPSPSPR